MDIGYKDLPIEKVYDVIVKNLDIDRKSVHKIENVINDEDKRILAERLRKLGYVI
jgi:hypothetical protein